MDKKDLEIFNNIVEKARRKATIYVSEKELEVLIKIKKELGGIRLWDKEVKYI